MQFPFVEDILLGKDSFTGKEVQHPVNEWVEGQVCCLLFFLLVSQTLVSDPACCLLALPCTQSKLTHYQAKNCRMKTGSTPHKRTHTDRRTCILF